MESYALAVDALEVDVIRLGRRAVNGRDNLSGASDNRPARGVDSLDGAIEGVGRERDPREPAWKSGVVSVAVDCLRESSSV